ncbi:MAG: hypothetical protein LBF65_02005 [Holosporales bacterium]|jgi:DNA-binding protein Fis|nr:hypothetical protein [Holosporales bacterium]
MNPVSISSAIDRILDDFFLIQKDLDSLTGVYDLLMREVEVVVLRKVLQLSDRNKKKAARMLGISRNTLHRKMMLHHLG